MLEETNLMDANLRDATLTGADLTGANLDWTSLINASLILVNRSFSSSLLAALLRRNVSLWILLAGVAAVLCVALTWPPAMDLFRFGPLHPDDLGISVLAGAAILVVLETVKPYWRRAFRS